MRVLASIALVVGAIALSVCEAAPAYPTADLVIAPDGSFSLDGKPVPDQDLLKALRELRERSPLVMLFIRTDGGVPHPRERIVSDAAYRAGITMTGTGAYREQEGALKDGVALSDALFLGVFAVLAAMIGITLWRRRRDPR